MEQPNISDNKAQKIASLIMSLTDDKDVATSLILEIWKAASPEQKTIVADMFAKYIQDATKKSDWDARHLSEKFVRDLTAHEVQKAFDERREELLAQIKPQLADALKNAVASVGEIVQEKAKDLLAKALRSLQ